MRFVLTTYLAGMARTYQSESVAWLMLLTEGVESYTLVDRLEAEQ